MEMKKYRYIERLKESNVTIFEKGEPITITEKIDGANCGIRYDSEKDYIVAQSRNNILTPENNLRDFYFYAQKLDKEKVKTLLGTDLILYGEWNVPHAVPYPDETRNKMYVFDLYSLSEERYLNPKLAYDIAEQLGLPTVTVFYEGEFQSYEHCLSFVGQTALGGEFGEGVVVKGDNKSIKFVGEKFAETKHSKVKKSLTPEEIEAKAKAEETVKSIVTEARINKELLKMIDEGILPAKWEGKDMGTIAKNLPKRIFADCIKEEPEVIDLIGGDRFGKLCNHIVMSTARKFLEKSFISA